MVLSLFVYTIISLKQPQFFLALVKKQSQFNFLIWGVVVDTTGFFIA